RTFDGLGAALATTTVLAVVAGVLAAAQAGVGSSEVLLAGVVAVVAGAGFVLAERRAADPILPMRTLTEGRVVGGLAVNMLGGAARVACFALVALLLQQVMEQSPAG